MREEMKYCMHCGTRLETRFLEGEGRVPWCPSCEEFCFPVFNTAVSMIVRNSEGKIILLKQYGRDRYIMVAGYVNRGEDAEDAVKREIREELDMTVESMHFNRSHYFEPSNTLMLNFSVTVKETFPHPNREVDQWSLFTDEEAKQNIADGSLAEKFLLWALDGRDF
ncbi:MAG: NUDIX domain-containing protein [Bilifractor sp.]|jgi:NAD+ diphosphatase